MLADAAALILRGAPLLALTALAGLAVSAFLEGPGRPARSAGLAVSAFLEGPGRPARAAAAGFGVLFGWAAVGSAFLGLALTGLYAPGPILGAWVGMALAGLPAAGAWRRRPAGDSGRTLGDVPRGAWGWTLAATTAVVLAAVPVLAQLRVPVLEQDSLIHGLALPAQWLLAHRAVWDRLPLNFHLPSPLEAGFALPLILGDERLAKIAVVSCAAAAWMVVAGRMTPRTGWLGAMLTLALLPVFSLSATAKSDVAAAAFLVAGMMLTEDAADRRDPAGWALLGCGVAAKFVYAPFVLVWLAVGGFLEEPGRPARSAGLAAFPPPRGVRLRAAALVALPSVPWWLAAHASAGDPWYPFASGIFHPFEWGLLNRETFLSQQLPLWPAGTLAWSTLPAAAWRLVAASDLWLLAALPGLVWWRSTRRTALVAVAGGLLLLRFGHLARYALPAEWVLAILAARGLAALGRPELVWTAGVLAVARIGALCLAPDLGLRLAGLDPAAALRFVGTTYIETADRLPALGVHRLLTVGEGRIYRLPARVAFNGFSGETPVVWQLAKESGNEARLAIRVREANLPWLLYNLVAVDWITPRYAAFAWDDRMLRLWIGFCRRHLTLVVRPAAFDSLGGAFALYRVTLNPGSPAPVWFVPGAEGASLVARSARDQARFKEALAAYGSLLARFPDVGAFHSELGFAHELQHDWNGALRETGPWIRAGMRDAVNLPTFAEAAVNLGRLDEAEPALHEAIVLYPGTRDQNRINLAWTYLDRARRARTAGTPATAAAWLAKADRELDQVGVWTDPKVELPRRECVAASTALHAALGSSHR